MLNKIEILIDAIAESKGRGDPSSDCYKLRNPLLTKSYSKEGSHEVSPEGYRIFKSWSDAYKAAIFDASCKIRGESRASVVIGDIRRKLAATDNLEHLLHCYNCHSFDEDAVVGFLRVALEDNAIDRKTPLSYFLPEEIK